MSTIGKKALHVSSPSVKSTHSKQPQRATAKTAVAAPNKGWAAKAARGTPGAAKANQGAQTKRGSMLDEESKALGNDGPTAKEKAMADQAEKAGLNPKLIQKLKDAGLDTLSPEELARLPKDAAPATLSVDGVTYELSKSKTFGGNTYQLFTSKADPQDGVVRVAGKGFTALVDSEIWGIQGEREFTKHPPLAVNEELMKKRAAMGLDNSSTVLTVAEAFSTP